MGADIFDLRTDRLWHGVFVQLDFSEKRKEVFNMAKVKEENHFDLLKRRDIPAPHRR